MSRNGEVNDRDDRDVNGDSDSSINSNDDNHINLFMHSS